MARKRWWDSRASSWCDARRVWTFDVLHMLVARDETHDAGVDCIDVDGADADVGMERRLRACR